MRFASLLSSGLLATAALGGRAAPNVQQQTTETAQLERLSDLELVARLPAPNQLWTEDEEGEWQLHPIAAELARRAENGLLSSAGWLAAIRAPDCIHVRPTWPKDVPLGVWLREPGWLERTKITLDAKEPDLGFIAADNRFPSLCGNCQDFQLDRQRRLTLAPLPPKTHNVTFLVTIEQARDEEKAHLLWNGEVCVPVASVDTVEECLPHVSGKELDACVRAGLSLIWWSTQAQPGPTPAIGLQVDPPALAGVGVSLEVELLHDGAVVERTHVGDYRIWQLDPAPNHWPSGIADLIELPSKERLTSELDAWQLHVRGTSKGVLTLWEADRWWQGEFTVPLAELIERGH